MTWQWTALDTPSMSEPGPRQFCPDRILGEPIVPISNAFVRDFLLEADRPAVLLHVVVDKLR